MQDLLKATLLGIGGIGLASVLSLMLLACGSSPLAGNWSGVVKPTTGKSTAKASQYSETKQTLASSLYLNSDGSYKAKLQEVDYAGDWGQQGQTVTLTPKTYMGIDRANFPKTKTPTGSDTVNQLYKPYVLDLAADGKTMTHTDDHGTTIFTLGAS